MSLTFYIVDVFAEEKYAGNQLAVVRGGADLSDEALGKIALEMNYSETTFVLSDEETDGGYDVRIFTPGREMPFAGHPTLGTAYVIRHEILGEPVDQVTLDLKAGKIPVTFGDVLWMRQLPPTFGPTLDPAPTARALNIESKDLDDRFPVQEVSTGLPALIVPLKNLDALQRCKVDWERYLELAGQGKNLYVFCPGVARRRPRQPLGPHVRERPRRPRRSRDRQRRRLPGRISGRTPLPRNRLHRRARRAGLRD